LKRDKRLQARYNVWIKTIKEEYGSVVNYLMKYRLQWGKPDTLSLLQSSLNQPAINGDSHTVQVPALVEPEANGVIVAKHATHFTASTPPELISIIQNDWPYSVPAEIEHALVWTRVPIIDFSRVPPQIAARIHQDGIWGFTGCPSPPPSPSTLSSCLPSLADWGVTMDKLIRSPKGTPDEDEMVRKVGREVDQFVRNRWAVERWETAWFVNPPRLQSIPELSHIHVFARHKTVEDIAARGEF